MNGQNSNEINNLQNNKVKENNNFPFNNISKDNKNKNEIRDEFSKDNNFDELNLNALNEEYDIYISNLKKQLLFIKEERKNTENKYNLIKHRLTILKNQEKANNINFNNIKYRFKNILKNRLESQKKIKKNLKQSKYINNISESKYKMNKKNNDNINISYIPKNSLKFNRTYSNFSKKYNNKNNSIDYTLIENGKYKLKLKLIEKLKEDLEEKKKIEEELTKIENEELLLLKSFKNEKYG